MNTAKSVHLISIAAAALIGLAAGACKHSSLRIERVCKHHCEALQDCKKLNLDNCINDCVDTANNCDSDADVEMALDKLDQCKKEQCGQQLGCEVDAWVECKL